jgi:hypothetical protein
MKNAAILLTGLFLLAAGAVYAQSNGDFLSRAADSLEKQNNVRPQEKVYLHLDKPHYAIGDTIWFKAYTVIGVQHRLSALSGVLYVELIDARDSVAKRLTLPLISGMAWGDFTLARSYKPGEYSLRAYTRWMRNAGPAFFYNRHVQVGGMRAVPAGPSKNAALNPDVQFFPEGGELVNGIRSKIAVKAVSSNGRGQDIKGDIEDNDGNVVADFATQHLGMGVFAFTPQSGKSYKAKIAGIGESSFTVALSPSNDEGLTLALNNSRPDSIYIKVAINEKALEKQKNNPFYIIAQSNGRAYYTSQGVLDGLVYTAKVDKARFPSGIAQFTLFSQNGEPLAERIVFLQNNDTLKMDLAAPAAGNATRGEMKIALDVKDSEDEPVAGSFSVSVINESRVGADEDTESTILNNLLLASDLKGYIEQPNYYFTDVNDQTRADLDVLMLTQGYRRFDWKAILSSNHPPLAWQPEKALEISGTLKTPSGHLIPNGKITLVATGQNMLLDTVTDANGDFKFNGLYIADTAKLVLRARKANDGKNVSIYVKQPDYPPLLKEKAVPGAAELSPEILMAMQKDYEAYRQRMRDDSIKNGIRLKEVTIKGRPIAKPDQYNGYGAVSEFDVDMKKLAGENVLDNMLPILIPGFIDSNHHYSYEMKPVRIVIDGFPRTSDDINLFSPGEIESIRMISGTGVSRPTLMITTKRYAGTDTASTVKLKQVTIQGKKISNAPDLSRSSNLHGGGNADQVLMGDKIGGCVDLSDCLTGKIFGVTFTTGTPVNNRNQRPMSVIVDGVILTGDHLNDLNNSDIYSIEVLRTGAARSIYGTSILPGGALVVTMKHGGENKDTSKDTTMLKQVNINGKKIAAKKPELIHSDNLNGPGNADQVITGDKVEGCVTLSQCLAGKIAGVRFDATYGTPYSIRTQGHLNGQPPMVLIVDGMIMNGDHLNDLNPNDIATIEVLTSASYLTIYGSNASAGALVITTKRGNGGANSYLTSENPAGLITIPFNGFYKARTFYSPKYSAPKADAQAPDLRNTIYWNPAITTGRDGKTSFSYFNNDTKGVYRIVIEGIDANGNLGRKVVKYKVD